MKIRPADWLPVAAAYLICFTVMLKYEILSTCSNLFLLVLALIVFGHTFRSRGRAIGEPWYTSIVLAIVCTISLFFLPAIVMSVILLGMCVLKGECVSV